MGKKDFIPRQRGERGGHKGNTLRDKRTPVIRQRQYEATLITAGIVPVPDEGQE